MDTALFEGACRLGPAGCTELHCRLPLSASFLCRPLGSMTFGRKRAPPPCCQDGDIAACDVENTYLTLAQPCRPFPSSHRSLLRGRHVDRCVSALEVHRALDTLACCHGSVVNCESPFYPLGCPSMFACIRRADPWTPSSSWSLARTSARSHLRRPSSRRSDLWRVEDGIADARAGVAESLVDG